MAQANPISTVSNLAARDAAIVDHARLVLARSLEILRECSPEYSLTANGATGSLGRGATSGPSGIQAVS
ncbi:hypothetical protein [Bradyrhizobium sp. CCBAU 53421]|uniref:hypothetical protein n=1 Tax=Bradyrhizobium sp. CCBAU 53421 TaxID=1325120 RepID=UPI00188CA439|nr:hypothetical protein [Bradyrhizobium sp. CCBAU 53421]